MSLLCSFTVHGKPAPGGSKTAYRNPHTGRVAVVDASKRSKPWQALVQAAALDAYDGEPYRGPVTVSMEFRVERPRAHYGTGRNSGYLRESAPVVPTTRPDALKMARSTEDAITGVVWRDDSQIVIETLTKVYGRPGVTVTIHAWTPAWPPSTRWVQPQGAERFVAPSTTAAAR